MNVLRVCMLLFVFYFSTSCNHFKNHVEQLQEMNADSTEKQQLYELEKKWLAYEFATDTASIAAMMDENFMAVAANEISSKQQELNGIYKAISKMKLDSIFIDSFKIEEPFTVTHFDNTAVVVFACHTYKTNKGKHEEKRTRFYDVWRNINGQWKTVSSQATTIQEIK